jgi:phenolic acid decarboxylase
MKLIGKKIYIKYNAGYEYIVSYKSRNKLNWKGIAGPIKGYSSNETCHIVAKQNIFFVSWLEKNGASISQLLDFNKNIISTYITFNTNNGRKEEFRKGTIKILK